MHKEVLENACSVDIDVFRERRGAGCVARRHDHISAEGFDLIPKRSSDDAAIGTLWRKHRKVAHTLFVGVGRQPPSTALGTVPNAEDET